MTENFAVEVANAKVGLSNFDSGSMEYLILGESVKSGSLDVRVGNGASNLFMRTATTDYRLVENSYASRLPVVGDEDRLADYRVLEGVFTGVRATMALTMEPVLGPRRRSSSSSFNS